MKPRLCMDEIERIARAKLQKASSKMVRVAQMATNKDTTRLSRTVRYVDTPEGFEIRWGKKGIARGRDINSGTQVRLKNGSVVGYEFFVDLGTRNQKASKFRKTTIAFIKPIIKSS